MKTNSDTPFKLKLLEEFEANLNRVFGCDIQRFKEATRDEGQLDADIDELWANEGPQAVRKMLSKHIVLIHSIFTESDLGRRLTFDEFISNSLNLNVGLDKHDLETFRNTFPSTIFEANKGINY